MRYSYLPLVLVVAACSGNSLKVGSDGSGGSGDGDDDNSGGTRSVGGSNGVGGSSAARGGSAGDDTAGSSGIGAGGTSIDPTSGGSFGVGGSSSGAANGGSSLGGSSLGGTTSGPPITSCTDEFPFEGEWRGSILDFFFDPVDELRLSVRAENGGAGGFVGTITWGAGDPPAPATDPDAPYPPGVDLNQGAAGSRSVGGEPVPGFPYSVVRGAGCDATFRVTIAGAEPFGSWCELQRPIDNGQFGWACITRTDSSFYDDATRTCGSLDEQGEVLAEYPFWRCNLCGLLGGSLTACQCDASRCFADSATTRVLDFTLSADGNVLSGPYEGCSQCTMRLDRVTR